MEYQEKMKNLKKLLQEMESVVIAYSGGVDSSLVLAVALDALGKDNVLSVVANSVMIVQDEYHEAMENSQVMGAKTRGVFLDELTIPQIKKNEPSSWYYSKKLLYKTLDEIKTKEQYSYVVDGMIMDDALDYRPGLKARDNYSVRSVLQEAEFYKNDVRRASKEYHVSTWNKPSYCSVISRFEYNDELTAERVERVKSAEKYLKELGFSIVRVRDHLSLIHI